MSWRGAPRVADCDITPVKRGHTTTTEWPARKHAQAPPPVSVVDASKSGRPRKDQGQKQRERREPLPGVSLHLIDVYSRGSKNHHKNQCTPCNRAGPGRSCPRGRACNCCHYFHGPEKFREMASYKVASPDKGAESAGREPVVISLTNRLTGAETPQSHVSSGLSPQAVVLLQMSMMARQEAHVQISQQGLLGPQPQIKVQEQIALSREHVAAILSEAAPDHYED